MINLNRLNERIEELSKITEENWEGVSRRALTEEDKRAHELVKSWMEKAGMKVFLDPAGNLIGRKEGTVANAKPVTIGSHIDSVLNGGKYDGTIGVIGGIEVAQHIAEESIEIKRPIEIIAFCEEEGSRFGDGGVFGSRAMTGKITKDHLEATDEKGITRREALESFGLNPDEIFTKGLRKKGDMSLYLEMHIEQGPTLESKGVPVGIISGINGRYFGEIIVEGEANHVGATPMDQRYDALVGASEIVIALEEIASKVGAPAVGTVAKMEVLPGFKNVIPDRVEMSGIDIRDLDNKRRDEIVDELQNTALRVAENRGLKVSFYDQLRMSSALSSQQVINKMKEEAEKMNLNYLEMASGACHDAQFMAELCDIGMIFVRSTGGSHNPKESARIEDITLATELLSKTAIHYLQQN
ncbi:M20 family metallo-hydrolase [Alkalihalobacillus oceani]|uniref:M20 family metallo-hydrolase n=1 Tax=Halalkalibacter oceani TaxID=1653776 RepID=A0A9X2DLK1_9BACI|nr:M20 family metallo-hydrolase [Halalkalibacter oceani]MCM3712991.1 M20 family metallo-hydrolase [Halalkalibacter oceani]